MGYITDIFRKKKKTANKSPEEDKDGEDPDQEKDDWSVDREDVMVDSIASPEELTRNERGLFSKTHFFSSSESVCSMVICPWIMGSCSVVFFFFDFVVLGRRP